MAEESDNKTMKLLTGLFVVLIALTGVNTWLLWESRNANGERQQEVMAPEYLRIEPFTVNLQSDQFGPRLLYAGMVLEVSDRYTKRALENNLPQVRNRLLVMLSGRSAERIATSEGKQELVHDIRDRLTDPYSNTDQELHIDDVLFNEFIVQ